MIKIRTLSGITLLAACLPLTAAPQTPKFSCKQLVNTTPGGAGRSTYAVAINGRNQVAGAVTYELADGTPWWGAAVWSNRKHAQLLDDHVGDTTGEADVTAINLSGQAVGSVYDIQTSIPTAAIWTNGVRVDLPALSGEGGRGGAQAINAKGKVVGASTLLLPDGRVVGRATLWWRGKARDLGALIPGGNSWAQAINDNGIVVGESNFDGGQETDYLPVQWVDGQISTLALPDGASAAGIASINVSGRVVGTVTFQGDFRSHAYSWMEGQGSLMGEPPDYLDSRADAINALGEAVGVGHVGYDTSVPLYWRQVSDVPLDLNGLVGKGGCVDEAGVTRLLTDATSINDLGVIVANAQVVINGTWRAFSFLLTPR